MLRMARIGDMCAVGDGTHSTIARQSSGVLYLSSRNIKGRSLDLTKVYYISEEDFEKHFGTSRRAITKPVTNDLLFSIIGSIGEPYLVKEGDRFGISSSVAIVRPDPALLSPSFLFYWVKGHTFQSAVRGIKGGVAQGYVSLEMLRSLPVPQLPLSVQRQIAGILSAYDDLIENYERRIAVLEETARLAYEEWFGAFNGQSANAELGDVLDLVRDSTKAGEHLSAGAYVPIDCIARRSLYLPEVRPWSEAQSSLIRFQRGDILFGAMRPYFHKVCIAPLEGVTRSTCFVLRAKRPELQMFGLFTIFRDQTIEFASSHTKGSTIPYAVWDGSLEKLKLRIPSLEQLGKFDEIARPIVQFAMNSHFLLKNLRETRDFLLPRLMTGSIDAIETSPLGEVDAA